MDPATIGLVLGVAQTGMNVIGGVKAGRNAKAQRRHQRRVGQRRFNEDMKEMEFKAADINRMADDSIKDSDENANERGVYDSSIRTDATSKINDERNRRLAALERQKGYMTADLNDNNYMLNLQNQMANAEKWMQAAQAIGGGLTSVDWSKVAGGGGPPIQPLS